MKFTLAVTSLLAASVAAFAPASPFAARTAVASQSAVQA